MRCSLHERIRVSAQSKIKEGCDCEITVTWPRDGGVNSDAEQEEKDGRSEVYGEKVFWRGKEYVRE